MALDLASAGTTRWHAQSMAKNLSAAICSNAAAQAKLGMAGSPLGFGKGRVSARLGAGWVAIGNVLFQVCLPPSRLHAPVSLGDCAISRRTVMNNVGLAHAQEVTASLATGARRMSGLIPWPVASERTRYFTGAAAS
jgi:hypothetical protein